MAQDENPNNPNPYFYEARTADELLFGMYGQADWLTTEAMDTMFEGRPANKEAQQQEQRNAEGESREPPAENNLNQITQQLEEIYAENEPRGEFIENGESGVQNIDQFLQRQEDVRSAVEQRQGTGEQVGLHVQTPSSNSRYSRYSRAPVTEQQFTEILNRRVEVPGSPHVSGSSYSRGHGVHPAEPVDLNSPEPWENTDQVAHQITKERRNHKVTDAVQHDSKHDETIRWVASLLPDIEVRAPEGNTLSCLVAQNTGAQKKRSSHQTAGSSDYRRNKGSRSRVTPPDSIEAFASSLHELRKSGIGYEDIWMAIDLPRLPGLDDEMEDGFQEKDMDCGIQQQETKLIPWTIEEGNSPTLARIAQNVKHIKGHSVISAEQLFNHLFQLSRSSFLQREEELHLELWTHFMNLRDITEDRNFEKEAKEVIMWLETTFVPANLAVLTQNLVNFIGGDSVIRKIVQKTTEIYNLNRGDMTVLGGFYSLMSKHRDIMESNKKLAKSKRAADVKIKSAKSQITRTGRKAPKFTNGRCQGRDPKTVVTRESVMVNTFAGTRWLIVGSADAHYAFACSVLETAKKFQEYIETEHRRKTEKLKADNFTMDEHARLMNEQSQVIPGDIVARRVDVKNMLARETRRPIRDVENVMLTYFAGKVRDLEKIKVRDLFRCIGGRIPSGLIRILIEMDQEIENLRGVGSMEGMVVSDIVKVREVVEQEMEKNNYQQKLLERKNEYLVRCNSIVNWKNPTTRPLGAGGDDAGPSDHQYQSHTTSVRGDDVVGPNNHYIQNKTSRGVHEATGIQSVQWNMIHAGGYGATANNQYPQGNTASGRVHGAAPGIQFVQRNMMQAGGCGAPLDIQYPQGNPASGGVYGAAPGTQSVQGNMKLPGGYIAVPINQYAQGNGTSGIQYVQGNMMPATGYGVGPSNQYPIGEPSNADVQGNSRSRRRDNSEGGSEYSRRTRRSHDHRYQPY